MKQGFTLQILDKSGCAIRRKWFLTVSAANAWLDWQYPHRDELGYSIEIFYDQKNQKKLLEPLAQARGFCYTNSVR